jgi:hypothetical protein
MHLTKQELETHLRSGQHPARPHGGAGLQELHPVAHVLQAAQI